MHVDGQSVESDGGRGTNTKFRTAFADVNFLFSHAKLHDRHRLAWRARRCQSWFASFPPFSRNDWLAVLREGTISFARDDSILDVRLLHR